MKQFAELFMSGPTGKLITTNTLGRMVSFVCPCDHEMQFLSSIYLISRGWNVELLCVPLSKNTKYGKYTHFYVQLWASLRQTGVDRK